MNTVAARATEAVRRCRVLAGCSEASGVTTRTFLSPPMRDVHAHVTEWMTAAGMAVTVDHAGNIRGVSDGATAGGARLFVGSHLDTVPRAGAFDGVLGVMLGIALVESLGSRRLPFAIEVVGFSEEEGVRFGVPYIGSRALAGTLDRDILDHRDPHGCTVADAIRAYGLDPSRIPEAAAGDAIGYLEFHIEQGPVLESRGLPLGVVSRIAGQTRVMLTFTGTAGHAGTTPMHLRRDALAGAAEWIAAVERAASQVPDLVATVGRIETEPNATNVIAGRCVVSLDVRHRDNPSRVRAAAEAVTLARDIAARRGLTLHHEVRLDEPALAMDIALTALLERAVSDSGISASNVVSGAGHDAMVLGLRMPVAMLFLRSPGGLSHHPDEAVHDDDVAAALAAGLRFLDLLGAERS
ncbi:MAG TPA: allantoate amidohydrolase [Vicinamibacterales bacterium]|nr:allantoate amidohydrolase [Vicinamibacterales bacterium]